MNLQETVFVLFAALTLGGAAAAALLKNVFHNALALGLALAGLAGLFIFLGAEFLAAMQIIIYVGAIAVAIIFAVMLSQPMWIEASHTPEPNRFRAALVAIAFFSVTGHILVRTPWPAAPLEGDYSIARIGGLLLTRYLLPFEAISLVILVAIIGALLISKPEERR